MSRYDDQPEERIMDTKRADEIQGVARGRDLSESEEHDLRMIEDRLFSREVAERRRTEREDWSNRRSDV